MRGTRGPRSSSSSRPSRAFADLVDDPALAAIEHQLARAYWFSDRDEEAVDLADRALGRGGADRGRRARRGCAHHEGRPAGLGHATVRGRRARVEAGIRLAEAHRPATGSSSRGLLNLGVSRLGRDPRARARSQPRGARHSRRGSASRTTTPRRSATRVRAAVLPRRVGLGAGGDRRGSVEHLERRGPGDVCGPARRSWRRAVSRSTSSSQSTSGCIERPADTQPQSNLPRRQGRGRVRGRSLPRRRRRMAAARPR